MFLAGCTWIARISLLSTSAALLVFSFAEFAPDVRVTMFKQSDKIIHFIATGLITATSLIALPRIRANWLFASAFAISVFIEVAQLFSPRSADLVDLAASAGGILAVAVVYYAPVLRSKTLESG